MVDLPEPEAKSEPAETPQAEAPAPAAPAKDPRRHSSPTARRGSSPGIDPPRGPSSRPAGRTSGRVPHDRRGRSSRREAAEPSASVRPSGRHRAALEKRRNYAPVVIAGVLAVLVAVALSIRPMEKRSHLQAIAAGGKLGYEAAHGMSRFGVGAIPRLCGIVERGPDKGRLAAAAALAHIAQVGGGREVVAAIREKLERAPGAEVKAACAAALSQAGTAAAVKLAASLVTDPDASVRNCVVQGLACGRRTPGAAAALAQALGDEDAEIREFALDSLASWADTDSDLILNAVDAAIRLEAPSAHEGAARLLLLVAGRAGDERLKALLSKDSPEVRRLALGAVMRSSSADPEIHGKLAEILASPAEPVEVKAAALDATRTIRAAPAGEAALGILRSRGDPRLRAKAASAVAATCPEGAIETLRAILRDSNAPPKLRGAVLEAFYSSGRMSGKTQVAVARTLVGVAEGADETMTGLALLALRSVSGSRAAKYGPAQWRKWVERREWEHELIDKAHLVLQQVKTEYAEHGDPDRALQSELFNKVGTLLEQARKDADLQDKDALQGAISAIVRFKESIR